MNLDPRVVFGDLDLTDYPYSILMDEGDDGVAQNAYQSIDTELRDGTIVSRTHTENREVTRVVMVEGSDLLEVAESTAALARECEKPLNTLALDPGDGYGPPKVYETFTAQIAEVALPGGDNANVRLFQVTWPALPFARSVDPFTVTGVTSTGTTTTTVNDASSATGWSALLGTFGSGGGEVTVTVDSTNQTPSAQPSLVLTPGSPVDMAAFPFFVIKWRIPYPLGTFDPAPAVYADGSPLGRVASTYDNATGFYTSTYSCPDASVASLRIQSGRVTSYSGGGITTGTFNVTEVSKSDVAPSASTKRQKVTAAEIPGSARTPASLSVSHASSALGNVLVYTCPELATGYTPALSTWVLTAGTTVSGTISGSEFSATSSARFEVPARTLPAGEYQLIAHARRNSSASPGPVTFTSSCQVFVGGVAVDPIQSRITVHSLANVAATTPRGYISLGSFTLPPTDLPEGTAATVRVTIDDDLSLAAYDEAWLFYMPDDGSTALSQVDCSTGTPAAGGPSNRLWLQAADVDYPYPRALVGTQADFSDARGVSGLVSNWSEHNVPAGPNFAFVVTPGAEDAVTEWSGYARWHTHPAS